ncbi:MAG TPA: DUF6159 family protein [Candidatus Saccharimonadia bacterium]|nr:DUF6159 family protein [Candidatus Saccharimonadia bacterium]
MVAIALRANNQLNNWRDFAFTLALYFVLALITNFFAGAVIFGATQRFRGENPTISSSLAGAWRKFGPLAAFSLMMATIGLALRMLEDRVPFAGRIAVDLLGAAWSIANVFALPVIVLSEGSVAPFDATKQSVHTIKQIWGESIVVNLGIGFVSGLAVLGYILIWAIIAAVPFMLPIAAPGAPGFSIPGAVFIPVVLLAVGGFIALIAVLSVLSSIAKAALYHYATSGQAPEAFNAELLRTSMTPKKARKVF